MAAPMDPMIKGYIIQNAVDFMLSDTDVAQRIDRSLFRELKSGGILFGPTAWYPRTEIMRLTRAIADSQPDEKAAYDALVRCGEFGGRAAIGTFMKLLFKILTPKMFASKFPDFFKRDNQGGEPGVESIDERRVVLRAAEIEGYDHFGPYTVGFARIALGAMGLKNLEVTCSPTWSRAAPSAETVRIIATWE